MLFILIPCWPHIIYLVCWHLFAFLIMVCQMLVVLLRVCFPAKKPNHIFIINGWPLNHWAFVSDACTDHFSTPILWSHRFSQPPYVSFPLYSHHTPSSLLPSSVFGLLVAGCGGDDCCRVSFKNPRRRRTAVMVFGGG